MHDIPFPNILERPTSLEDTAHSISSDLGMPVDGLQSPDAGHRVPHWSVQDGEVCESLSKVFHE